MRAAAPDLCSPRPPLRSERATSSRSATHLNVPGCAERSDRLSERNLGPAFRARCESQAVVGQLAPTAAAQMRLADIPPPPFTAQLSHGQRPNQPLGPLALKLTTHDLLD